MTLELIWQSRINRGIFSVSSECEGMAMAVPVPIVLAVVNGIILLFYSVAIGVPQWSTTSYYFPT